MKTLRLKKLILLTALAIAIGTFMLAAEAVAIDTEFTAYSGLHNPGSQRAS